MNTAYNIEEIEKYFKLGCKDENNFKIGIELEHFIVDKDNITIGYEEVQKLMVEIMGSNDIPYYVDNKLLGFFNDDFNITLEPAAQLEISVISQKQISQIAEIYNGFIIRLNNELSKYDYRVITCGYNPYARAEHLKLIPKKRYELMDIYFRKSGKYGVNMMRATASTQVSIDYKSEKDCIKKFQLANILSPVFSLITDNSKIFETQNYEYNILRSVIWNNLDKERCGIFPCESEDFSFRKYAEYIYNMPAIVLQENDKIVDAKDNSAGDYYKDKKMNKDEITHILSMAFFDVRLKNYIEIRMADSMPIQYALAYAAIIKGIFYNEKSLETMLEYFSEVKVKDINIARKNIVKDGYNAIVYNRPIDEIINEILKCSLEGLDETERKLCYPLIEKKTVTSLEQKTVRYNSDIED